MKFITARPVVHLTHGGSPTRSSDAWPKSHVRTLLYVSEDHKVQPLDLVLAPCAFGAFDRAYLEVVAVATRRSALKEGYDGWDGPVKVIERVAYQEEREAVKKFARASASLDRAEAKVTEALDLCDEWDDDGE